MRDRHIDPREHTVYASPREFADADDYPAGVLTVMNGGIPIDIRYEPDGQDTTAVFFHAALDGTSTRLPFFSGAGVSAGLPVNRVYIADPSLYVDDRLRLGWYAGNRHQPRLQWVIRGILNALIPESQRVVTFGASGGGFAALYFAAHRPGAVAVPVNPQTRIGAYLPLAVQRYTSWAWGVTGDDALGRLKISSDLLALYRQRPDTRVLYVQNQNDQVHMRRHFEPFMHALPEGHRVEPLLADGPSGHTPPAKDFIRDALATAVAGDRPTGDGYGAPMTVSFANLAEARAFNLRGHGTPNAAREHADEMGIHFCEECWAVSEPVPGLVNDGHQCLENGVDEKFALPD